MGGMAAQIPIKNDEEANKIAMNKVLDDKLREVIDGHDGTWVAHPGLIPIAQKVFDENMPLANQIDVERPDPQITAEDLLRTPSPEDHITEDGLRTNLRVGVQYLAAWLEGSGCVPINNLMEDAATAEISRAQVWQWIRHPNGVLTDGRKLTVDLVKKVLDEEMHGLREMLNENVFKNGKYGLAARIFEELITTDTFDDFLTLGAYKEI